MKTPNNLLVAPLVCNLRMKSACEEWTLHWFTFFLTFLRRSALYFLPWVPAVPTCGTWFRSLHPQQSWSGSQRSCPKRGTANKIAHALLVNWLTCFLFNQNEVFDWMENLAAFSFLLCGLCDTLFDPEMNDLSYILNETSERVLLRVLSFPFMLVR